MNYSEPEWSQETASPGFIEVFKSGTIIKRIPIAKGTRLITFGRLPDNSVQLDHESVSRHHAVVQFGPGNLAFIFDLDSTHGTFLNKKQLPSRQYVKLTSENDIFYFGGSTRRFVLSLSPVPVEPREEAAAQLQSNGSSSFRSQVLRLFDEHGINQREIEVSQENGLFSCSLDYGEYISIDQAAVVLSSGTSKAEAFDNFFEDSFNLLMRLGLVTKERQETQAQQEVDDDDFSENDDEMQRPKKKKKTTITEAELVAKRDDLRSRISRIECNISELTETSTAVEKEEVDDFDIYIKEAKLEQIQLDIDKLKIEMNQVQKELDDCEEILKAIGHREESSALRPQELPRTPSGETTMAAAKSFTSPLKQPEKMPYQAVSKLPDVPNQYSSSEEGQEQQELDYNQFEDATEPNASTDKVDELKRKLGY